MSSSTLLDTQIKKATFWSAVVGLGCGVMSAFFPLDIPDGYLAENHLRIAWLLENSGAFVSAWLIQILGMLTLSGVFAGIAWQVRGQSPLGAILSASAAAMATMAFFIPKFIAVWAMPMLAEATTKTGAGSELATQLLPLLNVSIPYSLFTSMDYLGFWLYALAAVFLVRPLLLQSLSAKIIGIGMGSFCLLYHAVLIGVFVGTVPAADIGDYSNLAIRTLPVMMIATIFYFKAELKNAG
ncbi:MAG: hypothetical protein ACI9SK_001292 [Zhongshania sp.]|jgi:hypothetical protein